MVDELETYFPNLEESHYCEVHPDKETELRCNKCGRYMCAQCAVSTPIGYRCRECVRQVDDKFFNIGETDYIKVFVVAAGVGLVGGVIFNYINFFFLSIFAGIAAGSGVVQVIRQLIQGRRGRYTEGIAAGGFVAGGIIGGMIAAWLRYPSEFAEFWRQVNEAGQQQQVPAAMREAIPTLSDYILSNTLSIGMVAFVGIAAFMIYSRMKT